MAVKELQASAMFKTPQEMQKKIDKYFNEEVGEDNAPTISGLAYYLGFSDRRSVYDYKEKDEFTHTIKRAVLRCEKYCENQLLTGNGGSGAIFWAKNHGWSDKQEIEHSVNEEAIDKLKDLYK